MKNTMFFTVVCGSFLFLFVSLWCCTISVYAATCPTGKKYAIIQYDHTLRNVSTQQGSSFAQIATLSGGMGIQIRKRSVTNAGNDKINKKIWQLISTPDCYCESINDPAESLVTVKISGTCTSGKLKMHVHEEHPSSYSRVTCTGSPCVHSYVQQYPPTTSDYDLTIPFVNGSIVTQPYTCPNCLGNYSWKIIFTNKPPPMIHTDHFSLVPLISPLILNH